MSNSFMFLSNLINKNKKIRVSYDPYSESYYKKPAPKEIFGVTTTRDEILRCNLVMKGKSEKYSCEIGELNSPGHVYYNFGLVEDMHVAVGATRESKKIDFICIEPPCQIPPITILPGVTCQRNQISNDEYVLNCKTAFTGLRG